MLRALVVARAVGPAVSMPLIASVLRERAGAGDGLNLFNNLGVLRKARLCSFFETRHETYKSKISQICLATQMADWIDLRAMQNPKYAHFNVFLNRLAR